MALIPKCGIHSTFYKMNTFIKGKLRSLFKKDKMMVRENAKNDG